MRIRYWLVVLASGALTGLGCSGDVGGEGEGGEGGVPATAGDASVGGTSAGASGGTAGSANAAGAAATGNGGTANAAGIAGAGNEAGQAGLLAQEVTVDTELRNHPEVLWYPLWDSLATVQADWSTYPNLYTANTWPKIEFVDAPEFGMKAARFESCSLTPYNVQTDPGCEQIMNMRKYFNSNTKEGWTGTAIGDAPLNDLYARYCIMLEADVWTGMNELGVKLSGIGGTGVGGPFWHSKPDAQGRIRLTTYWYGEGLTGSAGYGGDWIQGKHLLPDTWHCLEQHLKVNSMNPDGTPNADGILEAWLDDELVFSWRDVVLHRYTGTQPIEIHQFHGQIYHGGMQKFPLTPIHYRVTGVALAKRRIGMPPRQQ